jgi:mevalonate kinase
MVKGIGYGKVILCGEHFVVHGSPAIAAGISNSAIVWAEEAQANEISTDVRVVPEMSNRAITAILNAMGIKQKYKVFMESDLPTYGGLGSSAAFSVALVRYMSYLHHMSLNDEQVNRFAYEGEKVFHGNPSGIDNAMATYGGVLMFTKGKSYSDNVLDRFKLGLPLHLAVGMSGKFGATAKMVSAVKEFKEKDEENFTQLLDEVRELCNSGKAALERGKLEAFGRIMNQNQALLSEIGVSIEENDRINKAALDAGALGAKLTGGGGGGCCIALAKDQEHAEQIIRAIKKAGFEAFYTSVR